MWLELVKSLLLGGFTKYSETKRDIEFARIQATNNTEERLKELQLKRLENLEQAQSDATKIRLATKDYWEVRLLVFVTSFVTVLHYAAIALDSTFSFGWGIPKMPAPFDEYEAMILLFPFGYGIAKSAINAMASSALRR